MGDRLATICIGRKEGVLCLFRGRGLDPHPTVAWWAEVYLHDTKWHLDPSSRLTTTDMGLK